MKAKQLNEAKSYFSKHFEQPSEGNSVDFHGQLSVGAGFIKVLLFLEQSMSGHEVQVITGWGRTNKTGNFQVIYNGVKEKLKEHFENDFEFVLKNQENLGAFFLKVHSQQDSNASSKTMDDDGEWQTVSSSKGKRKK